MTGSLEQLRRAMGVTEQEVAQACGADIAWIRDRESGTSIPDKSAVRTITSGIIDAYKKKIPSTSGNSAGDTDQNTHQGEPIMNTSIIADASKTDNALVRGPRIYTVDEKDGQEIQRFDTIRDAYNKLFQCRNKFCMYSGHVGVDESDVIHCAEHYIDDFCSVDVELIQGTWKVWADYHDHDGEKNTSEKLFAMAAEVRIAERVARELNAYIEIQDGDSL